jgi:hypothetical protein
LFNTQLIGHAKQKPTKKRNKDISWNGNGLWWGPTRQG